MVHSASSIVSCCCSCVGGSSITILSLLVQIIRTFATVTMFVKCVLANTLEYHDTVDLVQDSETEDPHSTFLHTTFPQRSLIANFTQSVLKLRQVSAKKVLTFLLVAFLREGGAQNVEGPNKFKKIVRRTPERVLLGG